jgi:hypothetical protein
MLVVLEGIGLIAEDTEYSSLLPSAEIVSSLLIKVFQLVSPRPLLGIATVGRLDSSSSNGDPFFTPPCIPKSIWWELLPFQKS